MKKYFTVALLMICMILCGCGQKVNRSSKVKDEIKNDIPHVVEKDTQEEDTVIQKESEETADEVKEVTADADAVTILFELEEAYSGYLDELTGWKDCVKFANQDYDGDGRFDRVYMETTDSDEGRNYTLKIECSAGGEIMTDAYSIFFDPIVFSLDMDRDGNREIVVQFCSLTSSAPLFADEVELYRKSESGYERLEVPFAEDNSIELRYKKDKKILTVMNPMLGFIEDYEQAGEIDETWNGYLDLYDGQTENEWVYVAGVKDGGDGDRLVCMCQAFDKWSTQGIVFEMYMDHGSLAIENGEKIDNVYELNPEFFSPTWEKIQSAY